MAAGLSWPDGHFSATGPWVMPELAAPHFGFRHTLDSAFDSLQKMGIPPSNISVDMGGPGPVPLRIVTQHPKAGSVIGLHDRIRLLVSGPGFFHHLPSGYWHDGGEEEMSVRQIVNLIDDPIQKAGYWVREGALLFDIQPDHYDALDRFIRLFGLDPGQWPRPLWYRLAVLLPNLHRLAGREEGMRFALRWMLDLPLLEIRNRTSYCELPTPARTKLGEFAARLGIDMILGVQREQIATMELVIGAVPLATHRRFHEDDESRRLLEAVCHLVLPLDQTWRVSWLVLDANRAPRLAVEEHNARLGINSHLGVNRDTAAQERPA